MKVLYVISNLKKCGPVFVLYNLVKNLMESQCATIYIATLSKESSNSMLNQFLDIGIAVECMGTNCRYNFAGYNKKVGEMVYNIKPDLVHAFCFRSTMIVSSLRNCRKIVTIHNYFDTDFRYRYGIILGKTMEIMYLQAVRKYDKAVCVSNSLKKYLIEKYSLSNAHFIYNSVEKFIEEKKEINNTRKLNLIMVDEVSILKNNDFVIEKFARLYGNDSKYILRIYGIGADYVSLSTKYKNFNNIIFYGFENNKRIIFTDADYFISATQSESFHLSFAEALVNNIFCIVSDIPVHNEIAKSYKSTCEFFSLQKESELLECLERIKYNRFNINNENKFKTKDMANEYYKLYLDLMLNTN